MFRVVRPSPAVLITAATILGTATFVAVPLLAQSLLAQNGEAPKPAEAGKAESGKPDAAKPDAAKKNGETAKGDAAKGDPVKTDAAAKGEPAKGEPAKEAANRPSEAEARTLAGPAGRGECVWLGERAVGLMWKDDLDTAFRHLGLYDRFGCPGEHIQVSFRCVVRDAAKNGETAKGDAAKGDQGNVQKDPPKDPKAFDDRVHACWLDPSRPAEPANPAAAAIEKPGTK